MATPTRNSLATREVADPANTRIAALLDGVKWGAGPVGSGVTLTYSFPAGTATYVTDYGLDQEGEWLDGWSGLTAVQQAAFRDALAEYAAVSRLKFSQVADNATTVGEIRIAFTSHIDVAGDDGIAYTYTVGDYPEAADIWLARDIPSDFLDFSDVSPGSFGFATFMHEIGHGLGLKHPFDDSPVLATEFDNIFYTVMSYDYDPFGDGFTTDREPSTLMLLDIQAIQYLYGKNWSYHNGNDTYIYSENGQYLETIWDGGGIDTIRYMSSTGGEIDLRAGNFSELGQPVDFHNDFGTYQYSIFATVAIAYGTTIENATGSGGPDDIWGNSVANRLVGNFGDDRIWGLNGDDRLIGGDGRDKLFGGNHNDYLWGGPGNDRLEGGPGNDSMNGGLGADKFIFNRPLTGANADRISDFVSGEDKLRLDDDIFTNLAAVFGNPLNENEFQANATGTAEDIGDRILYNTSNGQLFYDADGSGPGAAQLFATLVGAPVITADDILVLA